MAIKKVLFLDDSKIDQIVDKLRNTLKANGHTLQEDIVDLSQGDFRKNSPENNGKTVMDFDKIKAHLKDNFFDEPFDLVACDYHFANDILDGYKILGWVKNEAKSKKHKIRHAKYILYSSEGDKLAQKTNSIEDIGKLIRLKLDDFIKREDLANGISTILLKEEEIFNFSEEIRQELGKYPNYIFRNTYVKFAGKTLAEIAHEIDKDLPHGREFQKNLVQLTIAHLIELNKIE